VCRLLDHDLSLKRCFWCNSCKAWICEEDLDQWTRRARAMMIRSSGLARAFAVTAIALVIFTLTAPPAAAQGPAYPYTWDGSWTVSTTPGNTGQNVYRAAYTGGACGSFAILPAGANIAPTLAVFTDSTVAAGASYCYGVTAIGANGKESAMDLAGNNPALIPPAPPTGFNGTVAKNANGSEDVIYAWKNPAGALKNTIYCGPKAPSGSSVEIFFPTTKVRVTTPAGSNTCAVTATANTGESGLSNQVKVIVP
jgi:hypothetical protein